MRCTLGFFIAILALSAQAENKICDKLITQSQLGQIMGIKKFEQYKMKETKYPAVILCDFSHLDMKLYRGVKFLMLHISANPAQMESNKNFHEQALKSGVLGTLKTKTGYSGKYLKTGQKSVTYHFYPKTNQFYFKFEAENLQRAQLIADIVGEGLDKIVKTNPQFLK